jgi:hypothetical protein
MAAMDDRPAEAAGCGCKTYDRVDALLDQVDEYLGEIRRLRAMEATGQDLSLTGAAAIISALVDPTGVDLDAREAGRAWLRAWESLPG